MHLLMFKGIFEKSTIHLTALKIFPTVKLSQVLWSNSDLSSPLEQIKASTVKYCYIKHKAQNNYLRICAQIKQSLLCSVTMHFIYDSKHLTSDQNKCWTKLKLLSINDPTRWVGEGMERRDRDKGQDRHKKKKVSTCDVISTNFIMTVRKYGMFLITLVLLLNYTFVHI